ncbi:MAG TPA: hypothetical protein DDZ57_04880 [Porphyromonadaceae bacterium]|jgi:hypothetical protein|nr:hypothetical protein [Porphyromonadaceae bacterium]
MGTRNKHIFFPEIDELIHTIFKLESKLFTKTESYRIIDRDCRKNCLSFEERQQLVIDIHYAFEGLIKILKKNCPSLTDEDIIFCCLIKTGIEKMTVGRCLGSLSRESLNQRKYRIKKKMEFVKSDLLFELIFS